MGKRCIEIANHILTEDATVREAANKFGISKSTVSRDIQKLKKLIMIYMLK